MEQMTEILGQTILDLIDGQNYAVTSFPADKYTQAVADTLEGNFDPTQINRSEVQIAGGVEGGGQTISLELAPYILPLRYKNEYRKLIHPDAQLPVHTYLIFESEKISNSKMKIVQLDDLTQLNDQIKAFFEIEKNWVAPAPVEEKDTAAEATPKKAAVKKTTRKKATKK